MRTLNTVETKRFTAQIKCGEYCEELKIYAQHTTNGDFDFGLADETNMLGNVTKWKKRIAVYNCDSFGEKLNDFLKGKSLELFERVSKREKAIHDINSVIDTLSQFEGIQFETGSVKIIK